MNLDEARGVFLSFEGASEGQHMGHPDFRVGGKIFATLQPQKGQAVLRLPPEAAGALIEENPSGFRIVSNFGGMAWVAVEPKSIEVAKFEPLAAIAYESRRR